MTSTFARRSAALMAVTAMVVPVAALARPAHHAAQGLAHKATSSREAVLETRLIKLEQQMAEMRGALEIAQAKAVAAPSATPSPAVVAASQDAAAAHAEAIAAKQSAAAADAHAAAAERKIAALADATPKLGFRSTNSTVSLSGYVKLLASSARYSGGDVASNTLGRDLYIPGSVPVFNPANPTSPTRDTDFTAKQTRFWIDANTKLGSHALKAYIEFDFQAAPGTPGATGQGTQRTTNAYDLAMRRAFIQFDRWQFGQDFTNFENIGVFPESTDYVGGVDGLVFVRQPMVRYVLPLHKDVKLYLAVENPETASATAGATALIENGTDHAPDATARLEYAGKFGFLDLATLWRQLRVDNAKAGAAHITDARLGWGVSASGKVFLNASHTVDVRFQATYGEGIGRYLGLNFSPDTVLQSNGTLASVRDLGLFGAGHIALDKQWRINLIGSFQKVTYADGLDRTAAGIGNYNRKAWSAAGNLFYSPVPGIDLGVEYRHGNRELVNALTGQVDRFDFAAKYSF